MKTKRHSSSNQQGPLPLTAVALNYFQSTSHAPPATSFAASEAVGLPELR
jgi:hypothetical protein